MLFHVSEQPDIRLFTPRPSPSAPDPVVWAIDDAHLRNYLLPRDCPRVTYYAGPSTTPADVDRFLGASPAAVAFESAWLDRVRRTRLVLYHFDHAIETFTCIDKNAGYYVTRHPVAPDAVTVIDDPLLALCTRGVEVRVLPSLWPLHDAVLSSSLQYSIVRMRNALPRNPT